MQLATSSLFEETRIEGLPTTPGPVKGWATWKGDQLHEDAIHATKNGLLIGYDIMALIGVDCCEIALADRGISIKPTAAEVVVDGSYDCWAVTVQDRLVPYMLEYSVCSTDVPDPQRPLMELGPERSLKCAGGYLAHVSINTRERRPPGSCGLLVWMPLHDERTLNTYDRALGPPYHTRRELEAIRKNAAPVLNRLGIKAVKLRYRVIDESELAPGSGVLNRRDCNTGRGREWLAKRKDVGHA
jgi:hypothetical protein